MPEPSVTRRLAAVLAADAAGYSRLMAADEQATVATLDASREIFREQIQAHHGRVVDMAGDSVLAVFETATGAVQAALEAQRRLAQRNAELEEARRMLFRIGVTLGEVMEKGDGTVYGDGVNIAARLERIGEPGGLCISGSVFEQIEGKLPLAFKFIGEQQVKNIPKPVRAYCAVAVGTPGMHRGAPGRPSRTKRNWIFATVLSALVAIALSLAWWSTRPGPDLAIASLLAMPKGASIAVLPFDNLSGDPEQEDFADGITEDILTQLSKFADLKVIARNSSFKYKGKPVDVRDVGRDLGADYVLEGSVRRTATKVRVVTQLLKTSDGAHVWADTYNRDLTTQDVLAIQDDITATVSAAIGGVQGAIASRQLQVVRQGAPKDIASYDCLLLAYNYQRVVNADAHRQARDCLEALVVREPNYVDALGWLGQMYLEEVWSGFNPRPSGPAALDAAFGVLNRAVALDRGHQKARHALAIAYGYKKDIQQFRVEARRAIAANPNNIETLCEMALWFGYSGDWNESMALIDKAKRLGGEIPSWSYWTEFNYHYRHREYERAIEAARETLGLNHWATPVYMAAAYAQMGDQSRTKEALAAARRLEPKLSRERWQQLVEPLFPDQVQFMLLMEGFDKAIALEQSP